MIDKAEVRRLEYRIAKAERRLARGIDVRQQKYGEPRSESELIMRLKEALAQILS